MLDRCLVLLTVLFLSLVLAQVVDWSGVCAEGLYYWQWVQASFTPISSVSWSTIAFPTLLSAAVALCIRMLFPSQMGWVRLSVAALILVLSVRFITWRLFATLNFDGPMQIGLSLLLFVIDLVAFILSTSNLVLMSWTVDRSAQADRASYNVLQGTYCPSVDVLVPTYNEPVALLRRTIIGCQAIDYGHKQIYLVDDQRRSEMKQLAEELGCFYISRPDNRHAKAGNLNNALKQTSGELVVVFDADFIPSRNFLQRTIGFFQHSQVALVQTTQAFYNGDPVRNNQGLNRIMTNEQDVFFRAIQPGRDALQAVICCGSSFVVRRQMLEDIGGIPTETICEDFATSLLLQSKGYQILYLNEVLSAGASAETVGGYVDQRLRWGQGTFQMLFSSTNPLTMPGLNLVQRFFHSMGILYWLQLGLYPLVLLMPLSYLLLGWVPLKADLTQMLFYWLPYYLVNFIWFSQLTNGSRSAFWGDVYSNIICFPFMLMMIQTFMKPFGKRFKVTPKAIAAKGIHCNWRVALPLIITLVLYVIALMMNILQWGPVTNQTAVEVSFIWGVYITCLLIVSIQVAIDVPQQMLALRFPHRLLCQLELDGHLQEGVTVDLSEKGTRVRFSSLPLSDLPSQGLLCVPALGMKGIPCEIDVLTVGKDRSEVELTFVDLSLLQERQLIEFLFCQPGQWKEESISETAAFGSLMWSIFRLYPMAETR